MRWEAKPLSVELSHFVSSPPRYTRLAAPLQSLLEAYSVCTPHHHHHSTRQVSERGSRGR